MKKIFIAGDSTAAAKLPEKRPEHGWGEFLKNYFNDQVIVKDYAKNGRSTKSFIEEGSLKQIDKEINEGDYLLIQFGHNDQKKDPARGTQPYGDYQDNLKQFVTVAKNHHATPIVLSSVTRRAYKDGQIDPNILGEFPIAAKDFCSKESVYFVPFNTVSREFFNQFDEEETRKFFLQLKPGEHPNYPEGKIDNTHFNELGANTIAKLVAKELVKLPIDLKDYILEDNLK